MSFSTRILFAVSVPFVLSASALAQDKPNPPAEAPNHMTLPAGFKATLFAGEPDLRQPIAFTTDDRGRLWVAECYSYPHWIGANRDRDVAANQQPQPRDRILIFEDTDGDGHFDTCKVFADKLANVSGIQFGFGGVWVCATPNLLFIPMRDDKPAGPPEILLDGWSLEAKHNVFNSLTWGPDGWLYGCNGILATSYVGKPGTPKEQRTPMNCGVWRYHPTKKTFEVFAHGTTNPWGLDFDEFGEMFITNCVIKHLWHVVPGAHFQRMYGQDFNPHLYGLMESCADHIHWGGGNWTESRGGKGAHDQPGGGHAHAGCMIYLGDNWPDRYRNGIFMCNLHGSRINHDTLERKGSGYIAHHAPDFLLANDPWFRGLTLQYGPDGGVFVSDWCDSGECHNYDTVDATNGRIYKITYGDVKPFRGDLSKLSDAELVKLQLHQNDWFVRHARRILQERAAAGKLNAQTRPRLQALFEDKTEKLGIRLRALWALHASGILAGDLLLGWAADPKEEPPLRVWALRLFADGPLNSERDAFLLSHLLQLSGEAPPGSLKFAFAAAAQRVPVGLRTNLIFALMDAVTEIEDPNLALMVWYAMEPTVVDEPERAMLWLNACRIPVIREFIARRLAAVPGDDRKHSMSGLDHAFTYLAKSADETRQADVLRGIDTALAGLRAVRMPARWSAACEHMSSASPVEVRDLAMRLGILFGDPKVVTSARKLIGDIRAATAQREHALHALLQSRPADLAPALLRLLAEPPMRAAALRGLAVYDDPTTPAAILRVYSSLSDAEKADAIQTLASRPAYAKALLDALEKGQIPRRDVSAFTARQLLALKDKEITERLPNVWGTLRPASEEKATLMARYKALLTPETLKAADRSNGRVLFNRTCASCHILFNEGGKIGPELTGSQRTNLDYLLENILDPSAVVPADYQVTIFQTKDGRVISGIIKAENEKVVTVQTQNEVLHLPVNEIEERTKSAVSMMPEGLLANLKDDETRDLIGYLMGTDQSAPKK
jgi:putative membrane-bound dehydrogenase-like protein